MLIFFDFHRFAMSFHSFSLKSIDFVKKWCKFTKKVGILRGSGACGCRHSRAESSLFSNWRHSHAKLPGGVGCCLSVCKSSQNAWDIRKFLPLGGSWKPLGGLLAASWGSLGGLLGAWPLGAVLEASCRPPGGLLGAFQKPLKTRWF